jgi:hypothetical protein
LKQECIFRTFLDINGDTLVAMLVADASGEIDREVYDERRTVVADLDSPAPEDEAHTTVVAVGEPA